MDYEHEGSDKRDPLEAMFDAFYKDLADILENGDTNLATDPTLKVMDGAIKRGKYPKGVGFPYAALYRELKPRKDTVEYTLYVTMDVLW
jgi:hypothetical protein